MADQINHFTNSIQSFLEPKQFLKNSVNLKLPIDSFKKEDEKRTGRWSAEEDELLKKIVPFYGEKQWRKISQHMKGRSAIQCLHRWTKILKPGLVKGPWTTEEDQKLYEWVAKEGPTKWSQCSQIIIGRSGKQCRERWFNNLNPVVKKGNWSIEEDDLIFKLYMQYGSSWSKIAKHLKGRTENSIKNRFYSTIRKIAADRKKINQVKQEDKLQTIEEEEKAEQIFHNQNPELGDDKSGVMNNNHVHDLSFNTSTKENDNKFSQTFFANNLQTNTLYKLLQEKGSDILDPLTKEAECARKEKKNIQKENLENHNRMNIEDGFLSALNKEIAPSECDSDSQFENLLLTIENTLNKELMLKEMNSYKNMTLDELQQKVFQFCNNNIVEFKEEEPNIQKDIMDINKKLGQDMRNLKPQNEIAQSFQTNLLNKSIDKPMLNFLENKAPLVPSEPKTASQSSLNNNNKNNNCKSSSNSNTNNNNTSNPNGNVSDDQKMYFLIQQLHSLEGMLSNTREELMKLETSLNVNDKNNTLGGLFQHKNEEIDFFSHEKNQNNIFNEFYQYENSLNKTPHDNNKNLMQNNKRKSSFELNHEPGSDLFKKQKLNLPDFDINSLNFLNNILEDI